MNYTAETSKNSKTKKATAGVALSRFAAEVCRKSPTFPQRKLGIFIENFKSKALKPYLIDCDGNIDLTQIDTLEQYIKAIQMCSTKGGFTIPNEALYSILEAAEFWADLESKFSFDELIILQLSHIARTHCVVLYKKDMAPKRDTMFFATQITTGYNVRPVLVKRK